MPIGQWGGYFFLILLVKRARFLAHDWSSGCPATTYAIEKKSSQLVGSRFEIVDKEYIEELKGNSEMKTRRIARSTGRTFSKRNFQENLVEYEVDVHDQTLSQFYAFRNSLVPSIIFIRIAMDPCKIKD